MNGLVMMNYSQMCTSRQLHVAWIETQKQETAVFSRTVLMFPSIINQQPLLLAWKEAPTHSKTV